MSFRQRLIVLCGIAVAAVTACALLLAFLATRQRMLDDFDGSLREQAARVIADAPALRAGAEPSTRGLTPETHRRAGGAVFTLVDDTTGPLPPGLPGAVGAAVRRSGSERVEQFVDTRLVGFRARFLVAFSDGRAAVVARPLGSLDSSLRSLGLAFLLIALAGVAAVAAAVALISTRALRPVAELTAAAERIAATRSPTERIDAAGDAELIRLADAFNAMLDALEASLRAQRQLVADASHELRTPVTALRANVELFLDDRLPDAERERIRATLRTQVGDLSVLVADVVEVASADDRPVEPHAPVALHELVDDAVERARRLHPRVRFSTRLQATEVAGSRPQLMRAVSNVLDNAARFSPHGGPVEVTLHDGHLRVCDRGPGVDPEDRAHIFERFYRSPRARAGSGHGLGLAIVAQIARAHGATPTVEEGEGGGACVGLRFGDYAAS